MVKELTLHTVVLITHGVMSLKMLITIDGFKK